MVYIADLIATLFSVIAGSVSSPLKAAPVEELAVTCVTHAAAAGRGLTAQRLLSHDLAAMSLIQWTTYAPVLDFLDGLAIPVVKNLSQSARKVTLILGALYEDA